MQLYKALQFAPKDPQVLVIHNICICHDTCLFLRGGEHSSKFTNLKVSPLSTLTTINKKEGKFSKKNTTNNKLGTTHLCGQMSDTFVSCVHDWWGKTRSKCRGLYFQSVHIHCNKICSSGLLRIMLLLLLICSDMQKEYALKYRC